MRKYASFLGLTAVVFLSSCGPRGFHYSKPFTSQQQQAKDAYECRREATYYSSSASIDAFGGTASSGTSVDLEMGAQCLKARGYNIQWVE